MSSKQLAHLSTLTHLRLKTLDPIDRAKTKGNTDGETKDF